MRLAAVSEQPVLLGLSLDDILLSTTRCSAAATVQQQAVDDREARGHAALVDAIELGAHLGHHEAGKRDGQACQQQKGGLIL